MPSTSDWNYATIAQKFGETGCSIAGCPFSHPEGCKTAQVFCCALNLSDAIVQAGYSLPSAPDVNLCGHAGGSQQRVRNADGLARICRAQNDNKIDASTWANKPSWNGIVYFEGGLELTGIYEDLYKRSRSKDDCVPADFSTAFLVTGHIDLWDGTKGVHANYPDATTVWFWKLG